jgi:hypothetical protein
VSSILAAMTRARLLLATTLVALGSIPADVGVATACGGFFRPSTEKRLPSLAYEQSLILFDAARQREDFIREVTFNAGPAPFGFVVPTPARPEVAKLATSPFQLLRMQFPYERLRGGGGLGTIGHGAGSGQGFGTGHVKVLEVKKVGSFTAFVLAADDEKALAAWLKKNALVSTPEADVWLAHYVKMKFFFVAMRYDPPKPDSAEAHDFSKTKAETVRISFDTPLAYYPYFEPDPPKGVKRTDPRMLEIWLCASKPSTPVALRREGGALGWVRPFAEGQSYPDASRDDLGRALGSDAKLLPQGPLEVQRFMDQKRSRVGFGDVFFVPNQKRDVDAKTRARMLELAGVLDPELEPASVTKEQK